MKKTSRKDFIEYDNSVPRKKKRKLTREERNRRDIIFVIKFFFTLFCIFAVILFFCNYKAFDIKSYEVLGNKYTHNYNIVLDKYLNKNIFTINKASIEKQIKRENCIEFTSIKKYTKAQKSQIAKNKRAEEKQQYDQIEEVLHNTKENKTISKIDKVIIKRKFPNRLEITVVEKKPVCCFVTSSGKFLVNDTGRIYHKLNQKEKIINLPAVYSNRNIILLGSNITQIDNFQTVFLYELAKTCYFNDLGIRSIQMKNKFEIMMNTKDDISINFGVTADLLDKTYLLKQILREKSSMLDKIKEIYIINSKSATYKLRNNGQNITN